MYGEYCEGCGKPDNRCKCPSEIDKPVGLIGATYRSGTQWLYFNFKDAYRGKVRVHHEAPLEIVVNWPGITIGFRVCAEIKGLRYVWPDCPVIHITRDPVAMAISSMRKGYKRADIAVAQWYEMHMNMKEAGVDVRYRIEDIWKDPIPHLNEMAELMSLPRPDRWYWAERQMDQSRHYVPEHKVPGRDDIVLTPEQRDLAQEFGYDY